MWEASNACPMAVEFSLIRSIWSYKLDIELCMVSIIVRIVCMVLIIGGICASICGISASRWSMSLVRSPNFWVISSTPSSASNMDRSDQQIGISKQCFSQ